MDDFDFEIEESESTDSVNKEPKKGKKGKKDKKDSKDKKDKKGNKDGKGKKDKKLDKEKKSNKGKKSNKDTTHKEEIIEDVKSYNKNKMTYDFENSDEYQGLPIREVTAMVQGEPVYWINNGKKEIHHYKTELKSYLIPWFDRKAKYDADTYFESKGGWGLKQTSIGRFGENDDVIIDTTNELKVYDETVKYLKFVNTIDDLEYVAFKDPHVNDVYYVYDLTGSEDYDWGYLTTATINESDNSEKLNPEPMCTMSHYFILKDVENIETVGVLKDYDGNVRLVDKILNLVRME
jgi:hypothetical protein